LLFPAAALRRIAAEIPDEASNMPESSRFEALVLFLMSIISIAADLLTAA
jgi:hypothetical protein